MQINVAQLLKAPIGTIRKHQVDAVLEAEGCQYPVYGEVTLIQTNQKILVLGTLTATAELTCGRCLKPFTCSIPLQIEEEYYPTIDVNTGVKMPPPGEPGAFTIDEHHILDLSEAIRQYIVMALPMKPLCRVDCAGLCPTCGQDLNQGECECSKESTDPRWAELLKLTAKNTVKLQEKREKGN